MNGRATIRLYWANDVPGYVVVRHVTAAWIDYTEPVSGATVKVRTVDGGTWTVDKFSGPGDLVARASAKLAAIVGLIEGDDDFEVGS